MQQDKTIIDPDFLMSALNSFWHQANTALERKDLGDIERANYQSEKDKSGAMMDEIETNGLPYKKENALLLQRNKELESSFYMNICRAYNAGKNNALSMVAEGKKMGETSESFKSSHDYFVGEFPDFKTNVP